MADSTSSMSKNEKVAFASKGLPDPRFYTNKETEGATVKGGRKSRKQKRRHRRTRKSTLNLRKVR